MNQHQELDHTNVAVIDDEPVARREIERAIKKSACSVETFADGESALKKMEQVHFDLILCDLKLPGMSGLEVLETIKARAPQIEVILMTAYSTIDTAIRAIQAGAFHYATKPLNMKELCNLSMRAMEKARLTREKEDLERALFPRHHQMDLIGHSPQIQEVRNLIKKVSHLNCNVLIAGQSGTGKELVARALHFQGLRKKNPFISFNCGSFTEELCANELFGHERGAFTGATETQIGLIESAHKGTIFLDEIGAMPLAMQVKLLRFVQERTLIRVGGVKPIPVDVRLIAASNQDLKEAVGKNKFRQDLYYRLNVVVISLPSLRNRNRDIPLLIQHFLGKYNRVFGKNIHGMDPEAMDILMHYPFPGNVRELENIVERAVALGDHENIRSEDLPSDLQKLSIRSADIQHWPSLEEKEREYIQLVLMKTNYHKAAAAEILKIPRTTLWRKIKRHGIESPP